MTAPTTTFPLLNRDPITFTSAARHEDHIINRIAWYPATQALYDYLWAPPQRRAIASLTALHLGLEQQHARCVVQKPATWIRGSFNICIPVHVHDEAGRPTRKLLVRCPMGHKLAEDRYPGTVDEKLSTEASTYIWMQQHCPEIAIPDLLGFGFTDGRHFSQVCRRPFYARWARALWQRIRALVRLPLLSQYTRVPSNHFLRTGYVILDYIQPDVGEMLSITWRAHSRDAVRREILFRGLSRLILSVSRIALPAIGAWKFHDDGSISLSNRPLTCGVVIHENAGAPRILQQNEPYSCVEPYVSDLLTFHDGRFLAQPNAANNEEDCRHQMAVQALLRMLSHHYLERERRHGPFFMQFSDLHQSNILVDAQWNITAIIDLEWVCSRPAEMIDVPYWITGLSIDEVADDDHYQDYLSAREEFMALFEDEEKKMAHRLPNGFVSTILRDAWERKATWFFHCLDSVNAMYALFDEQLRPQFISFYLKTNMELLLSRFWCKQAAAVVEMKVQEREQYTAKLREMFGREELAETQI